jgi:hypothetical protein
MVYYAERTNYNHIYNKSYWGSHASIHGPENAILHARNWFVLKYKIVCYKQCPVKQHTLRNELHLDHTETYEDIHGRLIFLYSMYDKRPISDFTPIYSMYAEDQRTAIRIYETRKSVNKMKRYIASRLPDELNKIISEYVGKN